MSSKDPKKVYVECLSSLNYGYPLYEPCEVELGDIGVIRERGGSFQKLYNIAAPPTSKHPPPVDLVKSVPRVERMEAIRCTNQKNVGAGVHVSPSMPAGPSGAMAFEFANVHQGEAILLPGTHVVHQHLERRGELAAYMEENDELIIALYDSENFDKSDLVLVIGTMKTDHWAIAVNVANEVAAKLTFSVSGAGGANVWGQWSNSAAIARCGPVLGLDSEVKAASGANIVPREADKTLFISRILLRTTSVSVIPGKRGHVWSPSDREASSAWGSATSSTRARHARTKSNTRVSQVTRTTQITRITQTSDEPEPSLCGLCSWGKKRRGDKEVFLERITIQDDPVE